MANPLSRYYAKAYFKFMWGDPWIHAPMVSVQRCSHKAAPGIGQASFIFDYGITKDHGASTFAEKGPLGLLNYWVKISLADEDGNEVQPFWYGVVPRASKLGLGGVVGGKQTFQALGLEHALDRIVVDGTYVGNQSATSTEEKIHWFPGFNEQERKGTKGFVGNRSNIFGPSGSFIFSAFPDAKRWNAHQASLYIMKHYPMQEGMVLDFAADGQYEALNGIEEIWAPPADNLSVWQWLNLLIDRRRGLSFFIRPRSDADPRIDVYVFSVVGQDVNIGDRTLPANNFQRFFNPFTTFAETHLVRPIEITRTTLSAYDTIEVVGERMVSIATYSFRDNTLEEGWLVNDEAYYHNATEEARTSDTYAGMFTRFVVPNNWNRFMPTIISAASNERINFKCGEDGIVEATTGSVGAIWRRRQRMERNMPLVSSLDYSKFPAQTVHGPLQSGDPQEYDEWKALFAFTQLPGHIFGGGIGKYRQLDKLAENNTGLPNCHIKPLDRKFGFEIDVSPRHLFARLRWPIDANGAFLKVNENPKLFHTDIAVTAAVKCDERLRVMVNTETNMYTNERGYYHMVLNVPGADYWKVLKGTVVGIQDGALVRVNNNGMILRDDREVLDGIASFAAGWLGQVRRSVLMVMNRPDDWIRLGAYITNIGPPYNEEVNTVVSETETDFVEGTTTIQTGWGDYDIMGSILDEKKGIVSKRANWEWQMWG
jgi:hypothetical protein